MGNKHFKNEALTFMHLLRSNGFKRCDTEAEKVQIFYDFMESLGMVMGYHFDETSDHCGEHIANHAVLTFLETSSRMSPEFVKAIKNAIDMCFDGRTEKQEYLN